MLGVNFRQEPGRAGIRREQLKDRDELGSSSVPRRGAAGDHSPAASPAVFGQELHGGLLFVSLRRAQDDPPVDGQCVEEERSALAVVVGEEGADVDPEALLAFPGVAHGVGLVERPFRLGLVLRLLVMVFSFG
ncbi:hypothetical protein [Mesorhizobium sp. WSM3879]|uniref:hypothetical protein n=1 Tax=Mesorhizobium sp. WSM3879 TaxID=2029406 RepID=UPI001AECE5B6|nr:hypothetical protein [Mesorhizobium sp. WSM3879]